MSALQYDPKTGHFTHITKSKHKEAGEIAGYVGSNGYRAIYLNSEIYYAHRLAFLYMTGSFPEDHVDHINHIKTDNSWVNLRDCTQAENNRNSSIRKDNKSGVKGVCWNPSSKKWFAYISANKTRHKLGLFDSLEDAAKVVAEARKQLHGVFANQTNTTKAN